MSNNPPHAVLELDEQETRWLYHLLGKSAEQSRLNFAEITGMSSDDPRAMGRSMLSFAAIADQSIAESLSHRLSSQDSTLETK